MSVKKYLHNEYQPLTLALTCLPRFSSEQRAQGKLFFYPMMKVLYTKPALTYAEQLSQLKERGLIVDDEALFLEILEKRSYYRLSGYWYPLLVDKTNHIFKEGARFESAYAMYSFDRDLRQLIIKELEKIEIAVRAKMIYIFSHQFGPFWYTNPGNFKKPHIHSDTIEKIRTEFKRV